jgi:hypothetical protein
VLRSRLYSPVLIAISSKKFMKIACYSVALSMLGFASGCEPRSTKKPKDFGAEVKYLEYQNRHVHDDAMRALDLLWTAVRELPESADEVQRLAGIVNEKFRTGAENYRIIVAEYEEAAAATSHEKQAEYFRLKARRWALIAERYDRGCELARECIEHPVNAETFEKNLAAIKARSKEAEKIDFEASDLYQKYHFEF